MIHISSVAVVTPLIGLSIHVCCFAHKHLILYKIVKTLNIERQFFCFGIIQL